MKEKEFSNLSSNGVTSLAINIIWVFVFCMLVYLVWVALRIRVEYFDGYEILLNARSFSALSNANFMFKRALLMPILLVPVFLLERWVQNPWFALVTVHVINVGVFAALIFGFYKLMRLTFSRLWAAIGVLFFCMNPLLIHYAPFTMQDIPASLLALVALYRCRLHIYKRQDSGYWITSLCIAGVMLMRSNLIIILFVVFAYQALMAISKYHEKDKRAVFGKYEFKLFFFFIVLPVIIFFLVASVLIGAIRICSFFQAPVVFIKLLLYHSSLIKKQQVLPPINYIFFLGKSFTWPLLVMAALGYLHLSLVALKQKTSPFLIHLIWFGAFMAVQMFLIGHKEARYLIPAFPWIYCFAVTGIKVLVEKIELKFPKSSKAAVVPALVFLLLLLPAKNTWSELAKFQDPFYRNTFMQEVSAFIKEAAAVDDGKQRGINWVGFFYNTRPKDFVFDKRDPHTYMYDSYTHVISYFTNLHVAVFTGEIYQQLLDPRKSLYAVKPNIGSHVNDGDILVLNTDPGEYDTRNSTLNKKPLVVEKISIQEFNRIGEKGESTLYKSKKIKTGGIMTQLLPSGFTLFGTGITDGYYEVYGLHKRLKAPAFLGDVEVKNGDFVLRKSEITAKIDWDDIGLLSYQVLKVFKEPAR